MRYLVINAHMFGHESSPGEHVDWSKPDLFDDELFGEILGTSAEQYAADSPHMIVMDATCPVCVEHPGWAHGDASHRREPADVCRTCLGSGIVQP